MSVLRAWSPAIAIAAAIFVLSARPDLAIADGPLDLVLRKAAHLAVYAALAVACLRGLAAHAVRGGRGDVVAFSLAVAYAIGDEFHQTFTPGRSGTPRDVAIDAVGAAAGLLAVRHGRLRALAGAPA